MKSEKRKSRRVPFKMKVDCHYEGNFLFEYATDISQHGIFIETREPLKIGSQVMLQFQLPDEKRAIEVQGVVKWVNPSNGGSKNPGMGVQFANISDLDKETITSLIRRLAVL
jgi:uncharacterized protein (TIGR02266 family)